MKRSEATDKVFRSSQVKVTNFDLAQNVVSQVLTQNVNRVRVFFIAYGWEIYISPINNPFNNVADVFLYGFHLPMQTNTPDRTGFSLGDDGPIVQGDWFAVSQENATLVMIEVLNNPLTEC